MWIVSDIDGTLLAEPDRSPWSGEWCARVARTHRVVLASSRTVEETRAARRLLGWTGPMIAEDGAVLVEPDGTVSLRGAPVEELREIIRGTPVADEIRRGADSAPPGAQDRLASILVPAGLVPLLGSELAAAGLSIVRGGRWATISRGSDKGSAAAELMARSGVTDWAAIGNGPNDAPLLRKSGYPFVIRNPEGHDPVLKSIPGAVLLTHPGPSGWDEMLALLEMKECSDVRSPLDDDRPDHSRAGGSSP